MISFDPFAVLADMFEAGRRKIVILENFARDVGTCGYVTLSFRDDRIAAVGHGLRVKNGRFSIDVPCGAMQSLHHKEAVAEAMAAALAEHGITSDITSWVD